LALLLGSARLRWLGLVLAIGALLPLALAGRGGAQERETGRCGVERWDVKTLSDAGVGQVQRAPRAATVAGLAHLRVPSVGPDSPRMPPIETTVYRVRAYLVATKHESDGDFHAVLQGLRTKAILLTELPDPACVPKRAPGWAKRGMRLARAALVAACGEPSSDYAPYRAPVTVTGVGFMDIPHGQRGAPNALELHPLLSLRFDRASCHAAPRLPWS
jgi:hypothetical protein